MLPPSVLLYLVYLFIGQCGPWNELIDLTEHLKPQGSAELLTVLQWFHKTQSKHDELEWI